MLQNWIYFAKMAKTNIYRQSKIFYDIIDSTFQKDEILFIESLSEKKINNF